MTGKRLKGQNRGIKVAPKAQTLAEKEAEEYQTFLRNRNKPRQVRREALKALDQKTVK
jgi:hypothetical protein